MDAMQSCCVYNPYNENNREITLNEVQSILTHYGLPGQIRNFNLYRRAFIHKSYTKKPKYFNEAENIVMATQPSNCLPLSTKSNERIEFIGDGVLDCITKFYLYKRFPKEDEGFMTEKKIALVKNEHLGKLALDMNLHKWFIISKNAEEKNTRTNLKKLGCLFEAFLGAVFLDFNGLSIKDDADLFQNIFLTGPGFQYAHLFIENIFDKHVDWSMIIFVKDNYKNILQVKIQKLFKVTPVYIILDTTQEYEMGVFIVLGNITILDPLSAIPISNFSSFHEIQEHFQKHGEAFIFLHKASHKIKKKAEQEACKNALKMLESIKT
tara:strand:- start:467 stop:1435 length:969 start_codon:yes stop_codon:yes gene_type:complete